VIVRATLACLLTLAALAPAPASPASVSRLPEPMTQRLIVKFRQAAPDSGVETESVRGAARVSLRRGRLIGRHWDADVQRCEQRRVRLYGQRHRADQVDYARNLRAAADVPVWRAGQSGAD
jgi:hypothetical protein